MTTEMIHWGDAVAAALKARGVDTIFTLSGGHIFPIYDGAVKADIRLVDVRHEASAAFAAEAWGRLTRSVGVAAVTAGPGVFNAVNGIASANRNDSPLVVLGGRAPESRWGMGSLQEMDHVPVLAPLAKRSETATQDVLPQLIDGIAAAMTPPRGPVFYDFPLDLMATGEVPETVDPPGAIEPDPEKLEQLASLVAGAKKPMMLCGSDVWMDGATEAMRNFAETAGIPVFTNGMGRGTIPADHELAFSRTRSKAMGDCDLAIVAGTPFDFRLSFGDKFSRDASVVHLMSAPERLTSNRDLAVGIGGDLNQIFASLAETAKPLGTESWVATLQEAEEKAFKGVQDELNSAQTPIHPMRIYGELVRLLDRDAIVVGDGGDFVSYGGKEIPSYEPATFLDPGPFGCLGCGPGYAMAAKLLHPDRQVVLLLGDGAFGFAGLEFDSLVRHGLPVVGIVGNNGIWALEKHPMQAFFGYDVVADLRQETRYDKVVEALGGYGETVTDPDEIGPSIKRAFDAGVPALINVITDPDVVYPRSANLA